MSNIVYDTAVVRACIDCVMIMNNGDSSGMADEGEESYDAWCARMEKMTWKECGWEWSGVQCDDWDPENDVEHDEECARDGWFSWSACEWCESDFGGDRWNVAIMKRLH